MFSHISKSNSENLMQYKVGMILAHFVSFMYTVSIHGCNCWTGIVGQLVSWRYWSTWWWKYVDTAATSTVWSQLWVRRCIVHIIKTQLLEHSIRLQPRQHQPAARGWWECIRQHRELRRALWERIHSRFLCSNLQQLYTFAVMSRHSTWYVCVKSVLCVIPSHNWLITCGVGC